jgi:hypothetical protein
VAYDKTLIDFTDQFPVTYPRAYFEYKVDGKIHRAIAYTLFARTRVFCTSDEDLADIEDMFTELVGPAMRQFLRTATEKHQLRMAQLKSEGAEAVYFDPFEEVAAVQSENKLISKCFGDLSPRGPSIPVNQHEVEVVNTEEIQ